MKTYKKKNLAVSNIRQYLEPGPIVLVSSAWKNKTNIMTMGWYTVMEFTPSLIGCIISSENYSFNLIKNSKQCVINLPTVDLARKVVGIGNCSGDKIDKFDKFKLTALPAAKVDALIIKECYGNFECKLVDTQLVKKYNFFIFEVVRAQVATTPRYPRTIHFRGQGLFMVSGGHIKLPSKV